MIFVDFVEVMETRLAKHVQLAEGHAGVCCCNQIFSGLDSDSAATCNLNEANEKMTKEIFAVSVREAAEMKSTEDDSIKAIVVTGDDVEQLTVDNWKTIFTEYTAIVFSRTTPRQKMMIVEETKG